MSNTYQVSTLASITKSVAPAGMRECRIIFKQSADEKKAQLPKKESMGCFLPVVSDALIQQFAASSQGSDYLKECVAGLQDQAVRSVWLGSARSPSDSDFDFSALLAIATAQSNSIRLSKESIGAWFDGALPKITGALSLKMQNATPELVRSVAMNFKPHFIRLAERGSISFTDSVLPKFTWLCTEVLIDSDSLLELKMLEALQRCFVPSADNLGFDL